MLLVRANVHDNKRDGKGGQCVRARLQNIPRLNQSRRFEGG